MLRSGLSPKWIEMFFLLFKMGTKITEEKVKKSWTVVDAKTLKRDDIKKETVYCLNDDDETEIQKEDIIQGRTASVFIF